MFVFDHTNGYKVSEAEFQSLEALGFSLQPDTVEHPGSQFCRFINFQGGTLEFIEVKEEEAYLKLCGEDEVPFENGFSLRAEKPLKPIFLEKRADFSGLGIEFQHKNYDWKRDAESKLPGWNFLIFQKALVPGIYTWVTEYEEPRKRKRTTPSHKNTANRLIGAYWNVNSLSDVQPLQKFTGLTLSDGSIVFPSREGKFTLWIEETDSGSQLASYYLKLKQFPHRAVVLQAEDRQVFERVSGLKPSVKFFDRDAYEIRLNESIWDILVV